MGNGLYIASGLMQGLNQGLNTGLNIMRVMEAGREIRQNRIGEQLMADTMARVKALDPQPVDATGPVKPSTAGLQTDATQPASMDPWADKAEIWYDAAEQAAAQGATEYAKKFIDLGDMQVARGEFKYKKVKKQQNDAASRVDALTTAGQLLRLKPDDPQGLQLMSVAIGKPVTSGAWQGDGSLVYQIENGKPEFISADTLKAIGVLKSERDSVLGMSAPEVNAELARIRNERRNIQASMNGLGIEPAVQSALAAQLRQLNSREKRLIETYNADYELGYEPEEDQAEEQRQLAYPQTRAAQLSQKISAARQQEIEGVKGAGERLQYLLQQRDKVAQDYLTKTGKPLPAYTMQAIDEPPAEPTEPKRQQGLDTGAPQEAKPEPMAEKPKEELKEYPVTQAEAEAQGVKVFESVEAAETAGHTGPVFIVGVGYGVME